MSLKQFDLPYGEQVFKALADESRIRILHLILRNKEMCTSDLEHVLDYTQTKTSRHLSYLRSAGLVTTRKIDQWVYYALKEDTSELLHQLFAYLSQDAVLLKDQEIYQILYSNRELAINKLQARRWTAS
ncbi:ArsR/SmtB family transcription factor [Pontibacter sp. 13R65]|uniref:ArsR/SmtB family transcription factor n=1 Tax=Pontibacter sp. 13R65 TaxID=3127458 RepID=UPI00301DCADA